MRNFSPIPFDASNPKDYKACDYVSGSLAFFCIWGKDEKRLYYPYQSLSFFALSAKAQKLLVVIAGNYVLVTGENLKKIADYLQKRNLEFMRESPFAKELLNEGQAIITSITTLDGETNKDFDLSAFLND